MQVADVGRRSACSSMPGTPALHSRGDKKNEVRRALFKSHLNGWNINW